MLRTDYASSDLGRCMRAAQAGDRIEKIEGPEPKGKKRTSSSGKARMERALLKWSWGKAGRDVPNLM